MISINLSAMEFQMSRFLFLSISVTFLSLIHVVASFAPIDYYLVDCGSAKPTIVDVDNRRFIGDSAGSGSHLSYSARTVSVEDSNPDPNSSPIYHTARFFTRPSNYVFDIQDKGTHLVRLHFHRFSSSKFDNYSVQFHVLVNGYVLLYNYTAENTQKPEIKDYMIWVDDEKLVIKFLPSKKGNIGFVNAIEVISAPKDLVADVAQFVNSEGNEKINGLMHSALETVYRVNIGGYKVTPFNDSLWRTWVPDDEFLKLNDGFTRIYFSGRIKYQMGGASREVGPDNVYNTARVIESLNDSIPRSNITWEFPVSNGYKYLVRMHFCDIASVALGMLYFNVYVNGNLAYENLDLSHITNYRLASPFYADFVVNGESSGVITIGVGPSNMSMPNTVDAILNGLEIMKMNNSIGSLDGLISAESVMKCSARGKFGILVSLVAAMFLLLIASGVIRRRRVGVKDSVAWLPLPLNVSEDIEVQQIPNQMSSSKF